MKYSILPILLACNMLALQAQNSYPDAEFSNEIYYLKKDSVNSLVRLEKSSGKMESKTKGAGFGGYENGYTFDGDKSTVRINKVPGFSFVFSDGSSSAPSSPQQDSMMRANGVDPSMMTGMRMDPSNMITLYKVEEGKGKRKILMQKIGGAFGSKKLQSSDKYTFSVKKIRNGYWELIADKPLPRGEYAFSVMGMGAGNMDGSTTLYAFGID
jgi:hypothetical protein